MNRPGQPQQRPPNLTANSTLASQFRPSYPTYGMPPRNVLGTYVPGLQPSSHRTTAQQSQAQSLTPQTAPGSFNQARGAQSNYAFGGSIGQHPPTSVLGQQPLPSLQQQPNGTHSTMPSLLAPSVLGNTPPVSSNIEVALDPNDFPALGSGPTSSSSNNTNNGSGTGTTSYASQAGTGVLLSGTGSSGGSTGSSNAGHQARDFTPDDFPALGGTSAGQAQTAQQQNRDVSSTTTSGTQDAALSHPPGLNGFQASDLQQLRQNSLGPHTSLQQGTPGILSLGPTHRNIHPGFQGQADAEKQQQRNNYSLKLSALNNAAWNSVPTNQPHQPGGTAGANGNFSQSQSTHGSAAITNSAVAHTTTGPPFSSNGLNANDLPANHSIPNPSGGTNVLAAPSNNANLTTQPQHPQTPAQQVLISAADRWGLLSLIAYMRNASSDVDHGLTSIGTDLGTMGLDMAYTGNLYSTFITPWADQSAARTVEPDFHLPQCYQNVHAPPPGPAKAVMFSDETLFFMFYSSPRDALQEVAAQELWNRNWRFHKELRLWITKETGTSPSQKVQGGEQGRYTFWDPENWSKDQKELTVLYTDLEEKSVPAFLPGPGLVVASNTQTQTAPQQHGQLAGPPSLSARASFQMGMAGL